MTHLPYSDVDYCKYGMSYRKRTRLWNNLDKKKWNTRPLCKKYCNSMNGNRHKEQAQRAPPSKAPAEYKQSAGRHTLSELYVVPQDLITEIFESIVSR